MRSIAVLYDGYSDFLVIKKFVKCLWENYKEEELADNQFIDLEKLNITNSLSKYLRNSRKTGDFSYYTADANTLVSDLLSIYYACFNRILKEKEVVTNRELLIINADSELLLKERNNYFHDWAYNIKGLLLFSIEKFYEQMTNQGHSMDYLPMIIPLILFPSSEILVASCMFDINKEQCRHLSPNPALKMKIYGTQSIPEAISSGMLESVLDTYIVKENLVSIYREIPEVRVLMHTLSL